MRWRYRDKSPKLVELGGGIGSGGPEVIIGTPKGDFLGEVTATSFVTAAQLADAIGLTAGTPMADAGWLKFVDSVDEKTKYVSKRPLRHSIGWDHIHAVGAVFGTSTVIVAGRTYKVRLLSGANSNPAVGAWGHDSPHTHGCEWNRLLYRISAKPFSDPDNTLTSEGIEEGDWASYSEADLLTFYGNGNGSLQWCQETGTANSVKVIRGFIGVSYSGEYVPSPTAVTRGWRPVLELVE